MRPCGNGCGRSFALQRCPLPLFRPSPFNDHAMSSTHHAEPATTDSALPSLDALRAEIDRLDDALHNLLIERAGLVTQIAGLAPRGKVAFRPGREAEILRRLLARHAGTLPPRAIVRIWRELFAATTAMQGAVLVTVCDPEPDSGLVACAREHFGALTPLRVHRSPAQAIAEVSAGAATAAVLPEPVEEESARAAWWTALLRYDGAPARGRAEEPRIHIVARLPFWSARPEGGVQTKAMVVAASAADPSSRDRSLLGFEFDPDMSRARLTGALGAAGLAPASVLLRRDPAAHTAHGLIDVDGYVTEQDSRFRSLGEVVRRCTVLGAYAVPLEGPTA